MSITDMAIGAGIALGVAYMVKNKEDGDVESAVDDLVEGEILAATPSEDEILVAGIGGAGIVYIMDETTGELLAYQKVGTVVVEETPEGAEAIPDEQTVQDSTMTGSYFGRGKTYMGRTATEYTAKAPYRRGRNLRTDYAPIGQNFPDVDECSRAGFVLRDWYLKKKSGDVKPKNRKPVKRVSEQAAILASTPCEVYRKLGTGEMTNDAAMSRLEAYYAGRSFDARKAIGE